MTINKEVNKNERMDDEAKRKEWQEKIFPTVHFHNANAIFLKRVLAASQGHGPFPQNNELKNISIAIQFLSTLNRHSNPFEKEKTVKVSQRGLFSHSTSKENLEKEKNPINEKDKTIKPKKPR